MGRFACFLALACLAAGAQEPAEVTFGTTVASTSALQGRVYLLKPGTKRLPQFEKLKPVGSIYTTSLNIWPQHFQEGFPGVTAQPEWFAIDYTGKFWIEQPGTYRFSMLSDDGSQLWIDGQMVINLDGEHPPSGATMSALLSRGAHRMRVTYYQGPGYGVALVLAVAPPKSPYKMFHTDDFLPPKDPAEWVDGTIRNVERLKHPWVPE
jgi:hypothetical protein